jgi:hypothetical protein
MVLQLLLMRWERPDFLGDWKVFLGVWLVTGALVLLMTWAGYGNGPTPRFWGSPIAFADVLLAAPKILGIVLVALLVTLGWGGLRS